MTGQFGGGSSSGGASAGPTTLLVGAMGMSAQQAISIQTWTTLNFNTIVSDAGSMCDTVNHRIQLSQAGLWLVTIGFSYNAGAAADATQLAVLVGANRYQLGELWSTSAHPGFISASLPLPFALNDQILPQCFAYDSVFVAGSADFNPRASFSAIFLHS